MSEGRAVLHGRGEDDSGARGDPRYIQRKRLPAVREVPRAIFPASDINSSNLNRGSFNFRSPPGPPRALRLTSPQPRAPAILWPRCVTHLSLIFLPLPSPFPTSATHPPIQPRALASPVIPGFLTCLRRLRRPQSKVWGHTSPAGAASHPFVPFSSSSSSSSCFSSSSSSLPPDGV